MSDAHNWSRRATISSEAVSPDADCPSPSVAVGRDGEREVGTVAVAFCRSLTTFYFFCALLETPIHLPPGNSESFAPFDFLATSASLELPIIQASAANPHPRAINNQTPKTTAPSSALPTEMKLLATTPRDRAR